MRRSGCGSGKIRYPDELAARTALVFMPDKEKRREARVYRCPRCGGFHLTSRPRRGTGVR